MAEYRQILDFQMGKWEYTLYRPTDLVPIPSKNLKWFIKNFERKVTHVFF